MCRKLLGVLGAAVLLAALPAAAVAQEKEWVWKTNGKQYFRTEEAVKPFVMPATYMKEVAANEEGAFLGFKYTGKTMERVYFKEVPFAAPAKGHECTWRMVYVKKAMLKEHLCLMNGAEKPCPGMNAAGECLAKE